MSSLFAVIIFILLILLGGLIWRVRHRFFIPLARLRHTLSVLGAPPGHSVAATMQAARSQLRAWAGRAHRAERELALLASVLEKTHDGILVVDDDFRILFANASASRIFGHLGASIKGRRLAEVARERQIYEGFQRALGERRAFEGRIERLESTGRKTFQFQIIPLEAGKAAGVFLDITRLEHLERVRQEFLANVSHELRTPLASILAYVETLLDGAIHDAEHNVRFLEVVQKHAQRLNSLVNDISDLSAIESGHVQLEPTVIHVRHAVEDVMETLRPRADQFDVRLINAVPENVEIMADRRRFEQILINLLDNGIKFNRRGGRVRVDAEERAGETAIIVADTGIGIPPSDLPRIFERFYRVDKARSIELGGTGLGLAIVKHLVRIHGGKIAVQSQPGKGTQFTILWPMKPDQGDGDRRSPHPHHSSVD